MIENGKGKHRVQSVAMYVSSHFYPLSKLKDSMRVENSFANEFDGQYT